MKRMIILMLSIIILTGCSNKNYVNGDTDLVSEESNEWKDAYIELIKNTAEDASVVCNKSDSESTCINERQNDHDDMISQEARGYYLQDVNQDGIPEIFILMYESNIERHVHIYTWIDSEIYYIGWLWIESADICCSSDGKETIHFRGRGGQCWKLMMTDDGKMWEEYCNEDWYEASTYHDGKWPGPILNDSYSEIPFYELDDYDALENWKEWDGSLSEPDNVSYETSCERILDDDEQLKLVYSEIDNYEQIENIDLAVEEREINVISYRDDFMRDVQEYFISKNSGCRTDELPLLQGGYFLDPIDEEDDIFLDDFESLLADTEYYNPSAYDSSVYYRTDVNKDGMDDYIVSYAEGEGSGYYGILVIVNTENGWKDAGGNLYKRAGMDTEVCVYGDDVYIIMGDEIVKGTENEMPDMDYKGHHTIRSVLRECGIWELAEIEKSVSSYSIEQIFSDEDLETEKESEIIDDLDDSIYRKNVIDSWPLYNGTFKIVDVTEDEYNGNSYNYLLGYYKNKQNDQCYDDILLLMTVEIDASCNKRVISLYKMTGNYNIGIYDAK